MLRLLTFFKFFPQMPRSYTRKRNKQKYSADQLSAAIAAVDSKRLNYREASEKYQVPVTTLHHKVNGTHPNDLGRRKALSEIEELHVVEYLKTVAAWGFPFTFTDIQDLIGKYLKKIGRDYPFFVGNVPSRDWIYHFMKRHRDICIRNCQNIKVARASKSEKEIRDFFLELSNTFGGEVPPQNIFNYDETNLTDDPGSKKCVFKRGVKYPERVMNSSKASTSIMYCGSAAGRMLPTYVVYKAKLMYRQWATGGPPHTRFNRSMSGWFDALCFEDWFEFLFIPQTRHILGQKFLIGDNLSTHFNLKVLQLAKDNNITFLCLPSNATHIMQPLDVAFFGPMKRTWRSILDKWKRETGLRQTVTKDAFPKLLSQLHERLFDQNMSKNLCSGFAASGIYPLNPEKPIRRLPEKFRDQREEEDINKIAIAEAVLDVLKEMRGLNTPAPRQRRKQVCFICSYSLFDDKTFHFLYYVLKV